MTKYLLLLIVLFALCKCSKFPDQRKTYYFYDAKHLFLKHEKITDSTYWLNYEIFVPYHTDSSLFGNGGERYMLDYYYKYSFNSSSIFVKHKSVLDTINYFNDDWVKKKENLDRFWKSVMDGGKWANDTLKIYTIETIEGTDSLIFRRVHRNYMNDID
ncbi:MAG TPA: hypothetical protein VGK10_03850 [Prolixibacteraceae bacterium]|jgi:hypothetical protein